MPLESSQIVAANRASIFFPVDFLGLLRLEGPDVADYLQRVSSQDAEGMVPGTSAPNCLLTGKGKLLAHFRLLRVRDDLFLAETQRTRLEELRELLDRYIFTEKIELAVLSNHLGIGILGPDAPGLGGGTGQALMVDEVREDASHLRLRSDELRVPFCRIYALESAIDEERERWRGQGVPSADRDLFEAMRIDAGQPLFGLDADETTIPLEVGLDEACHPDKGCYTGQEIVARIRTYGHVNRKLMCVRFEAEVRSEPGSLIYDDGMEAGRLTSSYLSPQDGRWHGLALLPLAVLDEEDLDLRVGSEDGPELSLV